MCGGNLLDKERFADLIAPDERLRGAEFPEEIENLAVLENVRVYGERGGGQELDRLAVQDSIAMKAFRRAAVKQCRTVPPG